MEQALGDRMKQWENAHRSVVAPRSYLMLRLDGRAFHTYTRDLERPVDAELMAAIDATMLRLCEEIDGVRLGYCQSDEISLVVTDWRRGGATPDNPAGLRFCEPWLGGVAAKIVSISAAVASVAFNDVRHGQGRLGSAVFDSRVWTFPGDQRGRAEVGNYLLWRQCDAIKNSVTMAASALFSPNRLQGVHTDQKRQMLTEAGRRRENHSGRTRTVRRRGRPVDRQLGCRPHSRPTRSSTGVARCVGSPLTPTSGTPTSSPSSSTAPGTTPTR